jgi:ElaA protein
MTRADGTPAIELRWLRGDEDIVDALALRHMVFCGEQGVPVEEELDGRDGDALHLVGRVREQTGAPVVATLRLLVGGGFAKIGRVAVARPWRRRGIALQMLELALARAAQEGCTRARLAAQVDAIELYRRAGFEVESEPFEEAGIVHVWMGRALAGDGVAAPSP